MELPGVFLIYSGGVIFVAALLRLVFRKPGCKWIAAAAILLAAGFLLPSKQTRIAVPITLHDQFAPTYQFNEVHEVVVHARPELVYWAIEKTTAGEILFFRTLTWIRRFGRLGPENILNAASERPILGIATSTSFLLLAKKPGHEIVLGTLVHVPAGEPPVHTAQQFAAIERPGYAKATINFLIEEIRPDVCRVRTETRVYATDSATQRRFAAYWPVIYPGSALLRQMWLRAIRLRAERAATTRHASDPAT